MDIMCFDIYTVIFPARSLRFHPPSRVLVFSGWFPKGKRKTKKKHYWLFKSHRNYFEGSGLSTLQGNVTQLSTSALFFRGSNYYSSEHTFI